MNSALSLCSCSLTGYIIGIGIGGGLLFACICVVIALVIKKKKGNRPADYYRVNTDLA